MMSVKLVVLAAVVAGCCATPFYFSAVPELRVLRAERAPRFAYGFGSGFASDIAGVKHSNSFGGSIQTGDGQAYGAGFGSANDGVSAGGVGYAHTNPAPVLYSAYPYAATPYYTYPYNVGYNGFNNYRTPLRDSYGNAIATAQNIGLNGNSNAYSQNGQSGTFAAANNFNNPYQSRNPFGNLGGYVASFATSGGAGSNAKSFAQTYDRDGGINASVAAAEDAGDAKASTAQTYQQRGGEVQNSGATSINAPGLQAAHSHAINTGAGTFY